VGRYPNDADGQALELAARHGIDLESPVKIEFAVISPDEEAAKAIKHRLSDIGYEASISFDEGEPHDESNPEEVREFGPSWTVLVDMVMVPTYADVTRIQEILDKQARGLGGRSDGWGILMGAGDSE
jgi:hypothetical protein